MLLKCRRIIERKADGIHLIKFLFRNPKGVLSAALSAGLISSCNNGNLGSTLQTSSLVPTVVSSTTVSTIPTGARAVKILFQATSGGSFDPITSSGAGTPNLPGRGQQAIRIYNPDNTLLARGGPTSTNWPPWLSSFEIGVSGSLNSASGNPNCGNFAGSSEGTDLNCEFGTGNIACGAPLGNYRVSETDCSAMSPVALDGNGGPTDGIYFRAIFNRSSSALGPTENIMAVLEYAASGLNAAPADPANCFHGGVFSPESCSDFVWKIYLKPDVSTLTQPFLLLIPPVFSSVLSSSGVFPVNPSSGAGINTKQFILPLASDPTLSVMQVSRTHSNFLSLSTLKSICNVRSAAAANSPLCAGVIFYSITFYRI